MKMARKESHFSSFPQTHRASSFICLRQIEVRGYFYWGFAGRASSYILQPDDEAHNYRIRERHLRASEMITSKYKSRASHYRHFDEAHRTSDMT